MLSVNVLLVAGALFPVTVSARIDRQKIVSKYNIVRTALITNVTTPLQVGNGDFAFNVDTTGMQTYLPFNTLSTWAWHNDSLPTNGEKLEDYKGMPLMTHGREVYYAIGDPKLPEITQWVIGNPNRINLGRIGLKYRNESLAASAITDTSQVLDLWNGVITSTFKVGGETVKVVTRGDFDTDAVAFEIDSTLVSSGDLAVELDFPYPPRHSTAFKYEVFAGVYNFPLNHTTQIVESKKGQATIYHELQETKYFVNLGWDTKQTLTLTRNEPEGSATVTAHRYTFAPTSAKSSKIAFTALFSQQKQRADGVSAIARRNAREWNEYWKEGGFVDVTESSNPKANELQRRIIASQYHVRVNSAGEGQHPQESGLMNNGWYGKFHMEMVVWHMAHWSTWGRQKYFDRVFPAIYEKFLPSSYARAKEMGWEGARWPKMTDPITGRSSPGAVNGQLLWQQPHPMYLATLAYRANPTRKTLLKWDRVLTATADYIASYAWKNETSGHYDLGPPAYGVTENSPPVETLNLAYEVAYHRYGLDVARDWKRKLGQSVPDKWTTVASQMAKPPIVGGLYAQYEGLNSTWWEDPKLNADPRSLNMLQGVLPDTPAVDPEISRKTADKIWEIWPDTKIRGWGRPVLSINSARIGNPERAVYHLTAYEYWIFDDAGFAVRGGDGGTPPPFMPGNAGFLYAVAYMAGGWEGSKGNAPGFPKDGTWTIKSEGLLKAP